MSCGRHGAESQLRPVREYCERLVDGASARSNMAAPEAPLRAMPLSSCRAKKLHLRGWQQPAPAVARQPSNRNPHIAK